MKRGEAKILRLKRWGERQAGDENTLPTQPQPRGMPRSWAGCVIGDAEG